MRIEIKCNDEEEMRAAEHFLTWLCEQGEQDYWNWMEIRESEEEGPITVLRFDYDWKNMRAACKTGRLDKDRG